MAQTKRKKRTTKHRGNAAGQIEARGRTGRRLTPEEQKAAGRQAARDSRLRKPPTWNSAALKALAMAVILFVLVNFGVLGGKGSTSMGQALFLALMALVLYTPLAYITDKWVYNRQQKSMQQKKA